MKKNLLYIVLASFIAPISARAQFENTRDSVVQLYGIIMTADSLEGIPAVSVMVKGQNRGTITNNDGVFSIVVLKGDQVEFTHVSYKPKTIMITLPVAVKFNPRFIASIVLMPFQPFSA